MNWLSDLLEATKRAESPRSFIVWSGLSAVSAIVNNKIWINRLAVGTKLYPNIFVLIIADSGLRKGYATELGRRLVEDTGTTRVISGRSSIESIIQKLAKPTANPSKGTIIKDAIGYINADEFATSLVFNPDALTLMNDFYDTKSLWTNSLKSSGEEKLKNLCCTLLGGINPALFQKMMGIREIQGGFLGRCNLVFETKRFRKDSLLRHHNDEFPYDSLLAHLRQISSLTGPFELQEEAIETYEKWYEDFEPESFGDKTGSANRVHDQILKVAMLLALCKRADSLIITVDEIRESMALIQQTTANVKRVLLGTGIHVDAPKIKMFIDFLLVSPGYSVTRSDFLSKHYGNIDRMDLDRIIETLIEAGGLIITGEGKDQMYTLTERALEGVMK